MCTYCSRCLDIWVVDDGEISFPLSGDVGLYIHNDHDECWSQRGRRDHALKEML